MTFKKMFLLLFISASSFTLSAQNLKFPIEGGYRIQESPEMTPQRFNIVSVEKTFFALFQDQQELQTFKLISFHEGGYNVEQYFPGDDVNVVRDKKRFILRFDNITEQDCFITIIYPERTDKIHLIKSEI